ncbi:MULTISPECIES: response regulator transcription factor [Chryseobacterium]|jgi:Response regulator containing a CheY-like receiver domain and an HTH DNA-binding domain|uniref:DNA-binding NarL/FixJ family response regulator n=1 Tax=Chryseobacterium rhizosphaerae TaxID=395937 RepID=A0AAE3YCU6_9FLAO|nr:MULTISPECIES: response regulator transcription factor [Chryseobacterium]MBL3550267.1 response regulator transcription factor [Chryseobacterium sp. KMC2]MDC8101373.1 response regulator transcription factor [Chryseobacterium rhizosphaerae]MDR6527999.1 DNA-binding NarL/FixJ family response regulator [Chryseobacterium rhizosphaerae]MDR6544009.1 DNA-binding NarL/FixJ family response regulator [Chryseobacterium rhizosphaerae]REC73723.1 DNA-binding response regulator [Chryseobacterium rhizosphaera
MSKILSNTVRFSIADSDFYFKKIMIKTLMENPFYMLLNDCNNGHELVNRIYRRQEDVFIIELFMPVLSGIEAIKYIRKSNTETPIVTYSGTFQEDMAEILAKIPNTYYCQKKSNTIKDIIKGTIASDEFDYHTYSKEWEQQPLAVQEYMDRQKKSQEELSPAEIQLMRFCYEGYSNKEIAEKLNLSTRTIDTYINRLTEKLGLKTKLHLIRFCVENGYYNSSM